MKKLLSLVLLMIFTGIVQLNAQNPDPALPELAWLTGYWTSTEDGTTIEELWTNGSRAGTTFTMKENKDQKVIFENLENDFPQRIIYSRSEDTLTARIEDESGEKSMEWVWTKTKPKF